MIQPLRTVHRRTFVALAFVLPGIVVLGLWSRHSFPAPTAHASQVPASAHLVRKSSAWQKNPIQSDFYRRSDDPQDLNVVVVLQPAQELNQPDLLLYWCAAAPQGNDLPGDALLLGVFSAGKAFLLPLNEKRAGYLVLFSSAHQAVFDTAQVETLP